MSNWKSIGLSTAAQDVETLDCANIQTRGKPPRGESQR